MNRYSLVHMWRMPWATPTAVATLRVRPEHEDEPLSIMMCSKVGGERRWRVDFLTRDGAVVRHVPFGDRTGEQVVVSAALSAVLDERLKERDGG